MNRTILSLTLTSIMHSPLNAISPTQHIGQFNAGNLRLSKFGSNFLYSNSDTLNAQILRSSFQRYLKSAIHLTEYYNEFVRQNFSTHQQAYGHNSTFYVIECEFIDCHHDSDGGAVFFDKQCTSFSISQSIFLRCFADGNGGAFHGKTGNISIQRTCFSQCQCKEIANAFIAFNRFSDATLNCTDSLISSCSDPANKDEHAPVVYWTGNFYTRMVNSTANSVQRITASFHIVFGKEAIFSFCEFCYNSAPTLARSAQCTDTTMFSFCNFYDNEISHALFIASAEFYFLQCKFRNNSCNNFGALGINGYVFWSHYTIEDCDLDIDPNIASLHNYTATGNFIDENFYLHKIPLILEQRCAILPLIPNENYESDMMRVIDDLGQAAPKYFPIYSQKLQVFLDPITPRPSPTPAPRIYGTLLPTPIPLSTPVPASAFQEEIRETVLQIEIEEEPTPLPTATSIPTRTRYARERHMRRKYTPSPTPSQSPTPIPKEDPTASFTPSQTFAPTDIFTPSAIFTAPAFSTMLMIPTILYSAAAVIIVVVFSAFCFMNEQGSSFTILSPSGIGSSAMSDSSTCSDAGSTNATPTSGLANSEPALFPPDV